MAYLNSDLTVNLSLKEVNGALVSLVRQFFIEGIDQSLGYATLVETLQHAGLPAPGSTLPGHDPLVVVNRDIKVVEPTTAECIVTYAPFFKGNNQSFNNPEGGSITGEIRVSMQQLTTNKYINPATGMSEQIKVQHTYPDGTSNFIDPSTGLPAPADKDYPGQTIVQSGEVHVFIPQKTFSIKGYLNTSRPWLHGNQMIGSINMYPWNGGNPYEWMCTEVRWQAMYNTRYAFTYTFQHNLDTWNPTAVFKDNRIGKPPPFLVNGVGIKYIPYHRPVDFNLLLGFVVSGA